MRITEILSTQEQINLVRLIMNTTLNALGQPIQPKQSTKSPVAQAVKGNRKPAVKAPKIPAPPAPKPLPKPKPLDSAISQSKASAPARKPVVASKQPLKTPTNEKHPITIPKSRQPLPTSVLSPINKEPTKREKKRQQEINDLIEFLKTSQTSR